MMALQTRGTTRAQPALRLLSGGDGMDLDEMVRAATALRELQEKWREEIGREVEGVDVVDDLEVIEGEATGGGEETP